MIGNATTAGKFLFGAAVGTGMTALAAERGGADFLLILNAGRLRSRGASSLSTYLPLRDANAWVCDICETEVLNHCSLPTFMGATVSDPAVSNEDIVAKAADTGFNGVVNFPSAWAIEGRLRQVLEREGIGFGRECSLIETAAKAGLKTLAYVTNAEEAARMADSGAQMLCIVVGFTSGSTGVKTLHTIEGVAEIVDDTLRHVPPDIPALVEGGPITTPEDALAVRRLSRAQGYIAGSTIDKIPLEEAIEQVVKSYKVINRLSAGDMAERGATGLDGKTDLIGTVRRQADAATQSDEPVMITGPDGTGKSRLAQHIHSSSRFGGRRPVTVNCNSLIAEEAAVQLFGRAAGHGARGTAAAGGLLESAHQTTLILEEVGALEASVQGLLVDFIDSGRVVRFGSTLPNTVDCRIIATSNRDLDALVAEGSFQRDLYYRLAVHHIDIPALAKRSDDIVVLAERLFREIDGTGKRKLSNAAFDVLLSHDWPGNIRELRNAIVRANANASGHLVSAKAFDFLRRHKELREHAAGEVEHRDDGPGGRVPVNAENTDVQPLQAMTEREWIAEALRRNRFRKGQTAAELGISTRTLYNKIVKYGLY